MNEKLKFSFGHILAFLGLIFISYITFMGVVYWSGGDFIIGYICTGAIALALLFFLLLIQFKKGSEQHYHSNIVAERILFPVFIIICGLAWIPFSHFWCVQSQSSELESEFSSSISGSKNLFTEYEAGCDKRITAFKDSCATSGSTGMEAIHYNNVAELLELQLRPAYYTELMTKAYAWIDDASDGCSVFNVFLIGNLKEIGDAIKEWDDDLHALWDKNTFAEEKDFGTSFELGSLSSETIGKLESLNNRYKDHNWTPGILSIISGLFAYFLLFVPYFIQRRHTRSTYKFFGRRKDVLLSEEHSVEMPSISSSTSKVDNATLSFDFLGNGKKK